MGVDERARHRLNIRLEELLGVEEAAILMDYLPPGGWADVATKRDIDGLAAATKRDIDGLKKDFEAMEYRLLATLRADLLHQSRTIFLAFTASVVSIGGLVIAAARLA